jgi:hypothetical protein
MSGRGIDFLANWLQRNVTEADKKGSRERAKELADKCIAEAAARASPSMTWNPSGAALKPSSMRRCKTT